MASTSCTSARFVHASAPASVDFYGLIATNPLETDERGEIVRHPVFLDFAAIGDSHRGCVGRIGVKTLPGSATTPLRRAG